MLNTATFQTNKKSDMLMLIKIAKQFGITVQYKTPSKNTYPLDDYDYELANSADSNEEMVPFDKALKECGLTYADIQN